VHFGFTTVTTARNQRLGERGVWWEVLSLLFRCTLVSLPLLRLEIRGWEREVCDGKCCRCCSGALWFHYRYYGWCTPIFHKVTYRVCQKSNPVVFCKFLSNRSYFFNKTLQLYSILFSVHIVIIRLPNIV